ncbi:MAG: hypothetical protein AB1414_17820 [bacterium]
MRLKLPGCMGLILIALFIPAFVAYAIERPLTLWIMPNEPSTIFDKPSPKEWEDYLDDNNILNSPGILQSDPDFACQIFNQRGILERIKEYKANNLSVGNIQIKFFKWEDFDKFITELPLYLKAKFSITI